MLIQCLGSSLESWFEGWRYCLSHRWRWLCDRILLSKECYLCNCSISRPGPYPCAAGHMSPCTSNHQGPRYERCCLLSHSQGTHFEWGSKKETSQRQCGYLDQCSWTCWPLSRFLLPQISVDIRELRQAHSFQNQGSISQSQGGMYQQWCDWFFGLTSWTTTRYREDRS